jgi:hypothetical protein
MLSYHKISNATKGTNMQEQDLTKFKIRQRFSILQFMSMIAIAALVAVVILQRV